MKKINKLLIVLVCVFSLCACSNKLTGKVTYEEGKIVDEQLGIEADGAILVRKVEMVQYYKNEDGSVDMVLANYPIESFDNYTNPEFPSDITSKNFYNSIKIKDHELSEYEVNCLVYNYEEDLVQLTNLPENNGNKFNLIYKDNAYITASNDWEIGEIRVTYYVMNIDSEKEYSVLKEPSK